MTRLTCQGSQRLPQARPVKYVVTSGTVSPTEFSSGGSGVSFFAFEKLARSTRFDLERVSMEVSRLFGFGIKKYSEEWIESLSDEDWNEEREKVRVDYEREDWRELLDRFDEVHHKKHDDGKPWNPQNTLRMAGICLTMTDC